MQIYPILYKPKSTPKFLLKARIKSTPLNLIVSFTHSQSAFRFHGGINRARHKRHKHMRNYEKSLFKGMQARQLKAMTSHQTSSLKTHSITNYCIMIGREQANHL